MSDIELEAVQTTLRNIPTIEMVRATVQAMLDEGEITVNESRHLLKITLDE